MKVPGERALQKELDRALRELVLGAQVPVEPGETAQIEHPAFTLRPQGGTWEELAERPAEPEVR